MPDIHRPRVESEAKSRRLMAVRYGRGIHRTLRRREDDDSGATVSVDRPRTGAGGAAAELETV